MTMREQDARITGLDDQFIRGALHTCDQVMIAVHVQVIVALEASSELRMGFACEAKFMRWIAREPTGEGFPDVSQQHDLFEIPLQESEEFQKLPVVIPEAVRRAAGSQMKI